MGLYPGDLHLWAYNRGAYIRAYIWGYMSWGYISRELICEGLYRGFVWGAYNLGHISRGLISRGL